MLFNSKLSKKLNYTYINTKIYTYYLKIFVKYLKNKYVYIYGFYVLININI